MLARGVWDGCHWDGVGTVRSDAHRVRSRATLIRAPPQFIINAFQLVLLLLLIDFVTLSISTDSERGSPTPDRWHVGALCGLGALMGFLGLGWLMGLLYLALYHMGYDAASPQLQTFCFQAALFASDANVLIVREKGRFYLSRPSAMLSFFLACNVVVVVVVGVVGGDSVAAIPIAHTFVVLAWVCAFTFVVNDSVKVVAVEAMRRRWLQQQQKRQLPVPAAAATAAPVAPTAAAASPAAAPVSETAVVVATVAANALPTSATSEGAPQPPPALRREVRRQ